MLAMEKSLVCFLILLATLMQVKCKNLFIWKGTRWCGYGSELGLDGDNSTVLDSLSTNFSSPHDTDSNVDTCCREHDRCQHFIQRWKKKYHLVNWRPFTISSCECDRKFRSCLEKDDSLSSKDIKRIFFDILEVPCFKFELKDVKKCVKRTWFMACKKFMMRTELHAVLTDLDYENKKTTPKQKS